MKQLRTTKQVYTKSSEGKCFPSAKANVKLSLADFPKASLQFNLDRAFRSWILIPGVKSNMVTKTVLSRTA